MIIDRIIAIPIAIIGVLGVTLMTCAQPKDASREVIGAVTEFGEDGALARFKVAAAAKDSHSFYVYYMALRMLTKIDVSPQTDAYRLGVLKCIFAGKTSQESNLYRELAARRFASDDYDVAAHAYSVDMGLLDKAADCVHAARWLTNLQIRFSSTKELVWSRCNVVAVLPPCPL